MNSTVLSDHTKDGAIIIPSVAYGFAANVKSSLHYLEGQKLLYPAGQFFAITSTEDGKTAFVATAANARAVLALQISANRRYLAAAELPVDGEQQQVSVYNIPAEKKERTIALGQHTSSNIVVALSFSGDTKLLLLATGQPDWAVMLWRWQQGKVVMVVHSDQASLACLSPWDEGFMAVAGQHVVKSYRLDLSGANAKPNILLMLDPHGRSSVSCIVHLVGGMVAVGTTGGKIMICSTTGLLASYNLNVADSANGSSVSGEAGPNSSRSQCSSRSGSAAAEAAGPAADKAVGPRMSQAGVMLNGIQAIVQRGRGFVAAASMGDVYIFDPPGPAAGGSKKPGAAEVFRLAQRFSFADMAQVGNNSSGRDAGGSSSANAAENQDKSSITQQLPPELTVVGLSVSVTDDSLGVTTAAGQLLLLNIAEAVEASEEAAAEAASAAAFEDGAKDAAAGSGSAPTAAAGDGASFAGAAGSGKELDKDEADQNPADWQLVSSGFITGKVVGMDASQHLPLLLVASEDRWIRVWDWMRRRRMAARHLGSEQPLCCTLHPSGLMAAVGTNEALHVYWVARHALSLIADLPIARCSVARYSHGGSLLAAVGRSNNIAIYPTYYGCDSASNTTGGRLGHSNNKSSYVSPNSNGNSLTGAAAASPAMRGCSNLRVDDAAVLAPVAVLKGHVSSVTDMVFTGDDRMLISTGAGGAVYFWDLGSHTRVTELEYVDKKCVYCAVCYSDVHRAAIVRTVDGHVQHIQGGDVVYQTTGLGHDCCPMALTGHDRVILAATSTGSVISIGWPTQPEAISNQKQLLPMLQLGTDSNSGAAAAVSSRPTSVAGASRPLPARSESVFRPGSPRAYEMQAGSSAYSAGLQRQATMSPDKAQAAGWGSSTTQLVDLGSKSFCRTSTVKLAPAGTGSDNGSQRQQLPQHRHAAGATADHADGGGGLQPGQHEYRLHASRITAIKVLHTAGIMFTASADGLVLMSSLSLVLDGLLIEPPPLMLPPSATMHSSSLALSSSLGLSLAQSGTATGMGSLAGLPAPLVLVDEAFVMSTRDKMKAMQRRVVQMQREAQYQVLRQTQALRESLSVSDNRVSALQAEVEDLKESLKQNQAAAEAGQEQIIKELESLHLTAAEHLEGVYEARLALEKEKLRQMAAAKDDLELSLKEAIKRQATAADKQLAEVHSMYTQQLDVEAAKMSAVTSAAAEADAVWHEVLMQTEEDLEKQAQRESERMAAAQHTAEETEVKLHADINILLRTTHRLKSDKAADATRIAGLQQQVLALQQQLGDAAAVADKLRNEVTERDTVISDNYVTMQGLRRRVQELETHKFVLAYKAESAAAELQPKDEQLEQLQASLHAQDHELLASRSAVLAAQRAVAEKGSAIATAKQELWEAKRKLTHQAALLDAVAHDIDHVLQQPDTRLPGGKTASRQALEELAVKYCTTRGGGPRSSVQVEAEMAAHINAAEKKSNILEGQLREALAANQRNRRLLMADNSTLLADLTELQHSNKLLSVKLSAAKNQLAALQMQLPEGATREAANGALAELTSTDAAVRSSFQPSQRLGRRSQGGRSSGCLVPASTGQVMSAALRQQREQLAELQSVLEATTSVLTLQAGYITRLQQNAAATQESHQPSMQQHATSGMGADVSPITADATSKQRQHWAGDPAGPSTGPGRSRPGTADGGCMLSRSRPGTADGGRSRGGVRTPEVHSPPAHRQVQRPLSAGGQGMIASLKSDLEAWRAK